MNITLAFDQYLAIHRYKYLALYHALRAGILEGILPGGTQLPSTRSLAMHYDLSRGSVSQVYEMLLADGYVRTVTGRGTFVSKDSFVSASGDNKRENVTLGEVADAAGEALHLRERSHFRHGENDCSRARHPCMSSVARML